MLDALTARGKAAAARAGSPGVRLTQRVAMVARPARRRLARRIAKVPGQLGTERGLDHPARELGQEPARPGDLLRLEALQRVLERVLGQQARKPIPSPLNRTLVRRRARRISPSGFHFLVGRGGLYRPSAGPRRSPRPHTLHRTDLTMWLQPERLPDAVHRGLVEPDLAGH